MAAPRFDDERVNPADYDTLKGKVKNARELNLSPEETIRVIIRGARGQAMAGTPRAECRSKLRSS
jgi:hypothetical protein